MVVLCLQTKKDVDMKVPPRRLTACRTLCRLLLRFKGVESQNIVDLFRHLVCEKDPLCRSFVVQLSHVVAHRLEKVVVAAFEDDTGTYAGVSCHEDDALDTNKTQLDIDLLRYHIARIRSQPEGGPLLYSMCKDSSRVHGLGISNCAIVLPNNVGFWATPNVTRPRSPSAAFKSL